MVNLWTDEFESEGINLGGQVHFVSVSSLYLLGVQLEFLCW